MDQKKFEVLLRIISPEIVHLASLNHNTEEITAAKSFYSSEVYKLLEDEDTKLWHLSPLTIFNMYDCEVKTGTISFPEGA